MVLESLVIEEYQAKPVEKRPKAAEPVLSDSDTDKLSVSQTIEQVRPPFPVPFIIGFFDDPHILSFFHFH